MDKSPFFSIIIPAYNSASTIQMSIDSVLKQTFSDFEIIIVDDGSSDRLEEVVLSYLSTNVFLVRQENAGPAAARNRGVEKATGNYLIFLDSDDWLASDFLALTFESCSSANYSLALSTAVFINEQAVIRKIIKPWKDEQNFGPFLCGSYVISRNVFNELNGFDGNLFYSENSDLFLRLQNDYHIRLMDIASIPDAKAYIKLTRRSERNQKYFKKKYFSVKYFLKKHKQFFDSAPIHFMNFKRIEAFGAFQNGLFEEARNVTRELILKNPISVKNYFQFILFCFPGIAKKYYNIRL